MKRFSAVCTGISLVLLLAGRAGASDVFTRPLEQSVSEILSQRATWPEPFRVGVGEILYEGSSSEAPVSVRMRNELETILQDSSVFEMVTRSRLADLQREYRFQHTDLVRPDSRVKLQLEGVHAMLRGRYFVRPDSITLFLELALLEGGDIYKAKVDIPLSGITEGWYPRDMREPGEESLKVAVLPVKAGNLDPLNAPNLQYLQGRIIDEITARPDVAVIDSGKIASTLVSLRLQELPQDKPIDISYAASLMGADILVQAEMQSYRCAREKREIPYVGKKKVLAYQARLRVVLHEVLSGEIKDTQVFSDAGDLDASGAGFGSGCPDSSLDGVAGQAGSWVVQAVFRQ